MTSFSSSWANPTFAISAQLFPASRIVFNLCSSAGVHGVLVLLFLAGGGPIGEAVIVGASAPVVVGAALDGPDIGDGAVTSCAGPRFLLRAPVGEVVSVLTGASDVVGRACEGEAPVEGSSSVLSVRFDIERWKSK